MGIKLVVEVLDHYCGPDHKFRWLVAFAEKANDGTRCGWPGRDVMARRTRKSGARVSSIGSELVADGVLRRNGGGGRHRGAARYVLLPLIAQGSPVTNPEKSVQGSPATNFQGSPATNFQGSRPTLLPAETDLPNPSVEPSVEPSVSAEPSAQTILAAFIDWDRGNGGTLTKRATGQLDRQIKDLLTQGVSDRYIRLGLADWRAKGQHPSTLDSFVNAAMSGRTHGHPRKPSVGDRALAEAETLIAQLRDHKELA